MLSRCSHLFLDFRIFCFRCLVPVRVLFFSFNGNVRSKSGNKNSSKISLSRVTIERIPLSILVTISIILKVAERLVRAGADVRRCKNAKRFKTNSEVFDATDIKQTHTQKVYKIYQIPPWKQWTQKSWCRYFDSIPGKHLQLILQNPGPTWREPHHCMGQPRWDTMV